MKRSNFIKGSRPRDHTTVISSFIDATNVYGPDEKVARELRTYRNGLLKVSEGNLLPLADDGRLFKAGDTRVNENIILTSLHTLFHREHNRVAAEIKKYAPEFKDEQIYQLARTYVVSLLQKITVKDWLPLIVGPEYYEQYLGDYSGYDAGEDPSMMSEFSSAAFRFGHSLLVSEYPQYDEYWRVRETLELKDMFLAPEKVRGHNKIENLFRGLARTAAKEKTCQVIDDIRNFLFLMPEKKVFVDLFSFNIQRGRDHGMQGYNEVRKFLGLPWMRSFHDVVSDHHSASALAKIYPKDLNCDLWVGIVCEDPVYGGVLGDVGANIVALGFKKIRNGDKFWYERHLVSYLRKEIDRTTLADVIKRNTNIKDIQDNVFLVGY